MSTAAAIPIIELVVPSPVGTMVGRGVLVGIGTLVGNGVDVAVGT